jgi:hypothetical protein
MLFTDGPVTSLASRQSATLKASKTSSAGASTKSKGAISTRKRAVQTKRASGLKSKVKAPRKLMRRQDRSKPEARKQTKQATLIMMLQRPNGANIPELVKAIHWQAHSIRGAMSGALKKKLGLTIQSQNIEGRGRIYRIPA